MYLLRIRGSQLYGPHCPSQFILYARKRPVGLHCRSRVEKQGSTCSTLPRPLSTLPFGKIHGIGAQEAKKFQTYDQYGAAKNHEENKSIDFWDEDESDNDRALFSSTIRAPDTKAIEITESQKRSHFSLNLPAVGNEQKGSLKEERGDETPVPSATNLGLQPTDSTTALSSSQDKNATFDEHLVGHNVRKENTDSQSSSVETKTNLLKMENPSSHSTKFSIRKIPHDLEKPSLKYSSQNVSVNNSDQPTSSQLISSREVYARIAELQYAVAKLSHSMETIQSTLHANNEHGLTTEESKSSNTNSKFAAHMDKTPDETKVSASSAYSKTFSRLAEPGSRNSIVQKSKRWLAMPLHGWWERHTPQFIRDACNCSQCIDQFSGQKTFQTTDIPPSISPRSVKANTDGSIEIHWKNDIPHFDNTHSTILGQDFKETYSSKLSVLRDRSIHPDHHVNQRLKDGSTDRPIRIPYQSYIDSDAIRRKALQAIDQEGFVIIHGVPDSETAVEDIAHQIGPIRDTFYGKTWDVKSKPKAENVAYTSQYLGLHMDLLYMENPPGIQLLHCLKNTCDGGTSLFADSFEVAKRLPKDTFHTLTKMTIPYHYRKGADHYYYERPVIELEESYMATSQESFDDLHKKKIKYINYSPPFQAPLHSYMLEGHPIVNKVLVALKRFAVGVESESSLIEFRLQEGDCVIFNNRRMLHGRRGFNTAKGERWLKGTYVDTDVFKSRLRVLEKESELVTRQPDV